jgi:phage antirepressor YoqD-like protein
MTHLINTIGHEQQGLQVVGFGSSSLTMSSQEIADLVESRHDSVKRTIERLANQGVIAQPPTVGVQETGGNNRTYTTEQYVFAGERGKRDSIIVVAQLSPEFTARLVDRWQELELVAAPALPQSFAAALRLAAEQQEQIEEKNVALLLAAPKVEFVDRYVDATGNKGFRQVAKLLKANEARFREFLDEKKILYRLGGEWMPYQQHIDAGRFVVKTGVADSEHAYNQARFTPKGVEWIASLWAVHQLSADVDVGGAQ